MRLHNFFIDFRHLDGFDFYPTPFKVARRRFIKLARLIGYELPEEAEQLDLHGLLFGPDSTLTNWVESENCHFLLLAARWALACTDDPAAVEDFIVAIEPILDRFDCEGPKRARFALDLRMTWRGHLRGFTRERRSVRAFFTMIGAEVPEEEGDPDDHRLTVGILRSMGDAEGSQGKELKRRYGHVIGQPIPLQPVVKPLDEVAAALNARFPWAPEAVRAILAPAFLQQAYGDPRRAGVTGPILLVGPPGSGKTHLLTCAAELLGLPHYTIPVGGSGDSGGLAAVARGWSSTRPCGPFEAIATSGVANPVLILDELEKASTTADTNNGNVHGTLLTMLNGGGHYYDFCLLANVDLSAVNFWATANDLSTLRGPLADRFTVIRMNGPRIEDFDSVLTSVIEAFHRKHHLRPGAVPALPALQREAMRLKFKKSNGSIRGVERGYQEWLEGRVRAPHVELEMKQFAL